MKLCDPNLTSNIRFEIAKLKNVIERIECALPTFEGEYMDEQAEHALDDIAKAREEMAMKVKILRGGETVSTHVETALSNTLDVLLDALATDWF